MPSTNKPSASNLAATMKAALKDKVVTEDEATALVPAVIKDLIKGGEANAKETLALLAQNLKAFLEPFRANDLQEHDGVRVDRSVRYSLTDVANHLEQAAAKLDEIKGGTFGVAMGLVMEDGKITAKEAAVTAALGKKVVDGSANPGDAARVLRSMLIDLEAIFQQSALMGSSANFGSGPTRDEVMMPGSSKSFARLNTVLGNAIAKGLEGTAPSETVKADSEFAKGIKDIVGADSLGRRILLETLPMLVDKEVAMFDSTGLVGGLKGRMDQQLEARAKALLAHVDAHATGSDADDIKQSVYRLTTGKFLPPSAEPEFKQQLASLGEDDLRDGMTSFTKQVEQLGKRDGATTSFALKNEIKGLNEGIAMIKAALAERASAAGVTQTTTGTAFAGVDAKAVLDFLKADSNIASILAQTAGAKLDDVKFFSWDEARTAIKGDFGAGTNLDVVLENFTKANMLSADIRAQHAFARVTLTAPGEDPFPLTVVLRKQADSTWSASKIADGGIPL